MTYGVARLRGRLDRLLDVHLERGLESLPDPVAIHLRMGLYQLLYMDSVPNYAAVSQTVAGVRAVVGPGLAPLANAVLRKAGEAGEDRAAFPSEADDRVGHLAAWHSHPPWLVARWFERWGAEAAAELLVHNNLVPDVTIRPFRGSLDEAKRVLEARGIEATVLREHDCLKLDRGGRVHEALDAIEGFAQDPAAAAVAAFCGFESGARVADVCAAPGGKAMALAATGCRVLACDASLPRARLIAETVRRLSAEVPVIVADGRRPVFTELDGVLVDAPCTGTGTLRRHPDARWRLSPERLARLLPLQAELLDGVADSIRVGGTLVYATCSLEEEENEGQVRRFLARHPEFSLEQPPQAAVEEHGSPGVEVRKGFLRLLPTDTGYDGAFAARMKRIR